MTCHQFWYCRIARFFTYLATDIEAGAVLSLSLLGLGGPNTSLPLPLSFTGEIEAGALSQPPESPKPRTLPPPLSLLGDELDPRRDMLWPGSGSSSGLPKASGLEPPPVAIYGMPRLALLPLLPLRREGPDEAEAVSDRVTMSNLLVAGCVGDSRLTETAGLIRVDDSLTATGEFGMLPPAGSPALVRPDLISKAPGVRTWLRMGLGGRDIDLYVEAGLAELL
jgi:hypothetical protein